MVGKVEVYICDLHDYTSGVEEWLRADWLSVCVDEMYEWYGEVHREEMIIAGRETRRNG